MSVRQILTSLATLALALLASSRATAQFTWNGPFTGTPNWSAGNWMPAVPPAGGSAGTILTFNQLGAGSYTAANDLGNPFQLTSLELNSNGGGITVSNLAGNSLEFVGSARITQEGLGNAVLSAASTLSGGNTLIDGTNFGNLQISGVLSGPSALTILRPQALSFTGFVDLTAANSFLGGVSLFGGNLRVGNATALGSGTLTIGGGTLGATTTTTLANPVVLNADLVYNGFGTLTLTGDISENGSRGLVISAQSNSTLTLQGTSTYTGATVAIVNPVNISNSPTGGNLTLSGPNGTAALSSAFVFNAASNLTLDNATAGSNNNNRIGDSAPVTISGGTLTLVGANSGATLEDIGGLSGRGSVFVTVTASTTGNTGTTLQSDSLTRLDRAQFNFRGSSTAFGGPLAANVANLIFDVAPALTGGGGAAGTTTISIIPYAVGGFTSTTTGTDLVTYGPNGIRPLSTTANEYATAITSGSTTANNVRLTAAQAITAPTQINALLIATGTPFTGSTSSLTVDSGLIFNTSTATIPAAMTLDYGSREAIFHNNATLTVDGVLTGSNGLTKNGTSNLNLNNTANNVTGRLTLNQGLVSFTDPAAVASFNDITVNGRVTTTTPGLTFSPTTGSATLNQPISITDGFARFTTGSTGSTLTLAGLIDGPGGVLILTGNVEPTNTNNSYTGQTRVFSGNLLVSSDAVLGNGGGVDIGASSTTGLRLTGTWTTSRQINFSFASQVDTNGFDWTINSPLTGVAATLNKVGTGIWTLTQGGALGQSNTAGSQTTTTTLNIGEGELRVLNSSGSATGTATVNINSTGVLSGNGAIAGNTTISNTGTVNPGSGTSTPATLNFGANLTVNGTYLVDADLLSSDSLNVAGLLTMGNGSIIDLSAGT